MTDRATTLQIGKQEVVLQRFGLKKWMELEKLREAVGEAAGRGDPRAVDEGIITYLLAASQVDRDFLAALPWFEVARLYTEAICLNECHADVPLTRVRAKAQKPLPWDYPARTWYSLAHLLAKTYGWTLAVIERLDPDDAFPLVQEALTDEQLEREFWHSLSEVSYPYNKITKTQNYKPLPRPEWMLPPAPPIKLIKWRADFLPVGNVVDLSGMLHREQKPS